MANRKVLYKKPDGTGVSFHSYSAGSDWHFCKRKYKLSKIDGWKQKERSAAAEFGMAVEAAIRYYHENNMVPGSGIPFFRNAWQKVLSIPNLVYGEREGGHKELMVIGEQLLLLYETLLPRFGYANPKFQLNYKKEVFPGTELSGLFFTAYVDMLVEHTMIEPEADPRLILDIKVSGKRLEAAEMGREGLLYLDPQLRAYAWVSGVKQVGFLWFVKAQPAYGTGDEVTEIATGRKLWVVKVDKDKKTLGLLPDGIYQAWKTVVEARSLRGKALEASKIDTLTVGGGFNLPFGAVTKCDIQFVTVRMPDEYIHDSGDQIATEMAEIVAANNSKLYPQTGAGIRFPNNKCLFCEMRGICMKNKALVDEMLVNPNVSAANWPETTQDFTDWLEEFIK